MAPTPDANVGAATSSRFSPHPFLAGSIAGACGTLVGHPLDTLKTFAQAGHGLPPSLRSLYRGVGLPVTTAGTIQAVNLGIYENVRRCIAPAKSTEIWPHAVAGTTAGLCITPATIPLSRVKVQQQLTGQTFLRTAQSIQSLRSLYALSLIHI